MTEAVSTRLSEGGSKQILRRERLLLEKKDRQTCLYFVGHEVGIKGTPSSLTKYPDGVGVKKTMSGVVYRRNVVVGDRGWLEYNSSSLSDIALTLIPCPWLQ